MPGIFAQFDSLEHIDAMRSNRTLLLTSMLHFMAFDRMVGRVERDGVHGLRRRCVLRVTPEHSRSEPPLSMRRSPVVDPPGHRR